ncbi:hypothetical protein OROMI_014786 [Orobanche minor]
MEAPSSLTMALHIFIDVVVEDNLIPIRLDIEIDGQRFRDAFIWNPADIFRYCFRRGMATGQFWFICLFSLLRGEGSKCKFLKVGILVMQQNCKDMQTAGVQEATPPDEAGSGSIPIRKRAGRSDYFVLTEDAVSVAFSWNRHGQLGSVSAKNVIVIRK